MYNLPIPNLLNGVSQQPPPVRFPTQCERQVNAYSSPVEGLTKRPPTEHVSKMADDSDPGYAAGSLGYKFHLIDRGDGQEAYAVLARKAPSASCTECVKIYDLKNDGAPVPVLYAPTAAGYMVGTPETGYADIELVSIADYTFIVNRSVRVEMANATTPTAAAEGAVLWVSGTGYGQTYKITLKLGSQAAATVQYTTSDTSFHNQPVTVDGETFPDKSSTIDSSYIAANLKAAMEANATIAAGYDITRNGFAIFIKPKVAGTPFTINVSDGESGNDLRVAKDFVNRFEDLPIQAPHNFVIKIGGLPEEDRDDYYVKFVQKSLNTSVPGSGEWEETVQPGILTTIDAETMPHGLIRYFDDNGAPFFVFKPFDGVAMSVNGNPLEGSDISWGTRRVGDTQTNPLPSFVGDRISDIFIFKNRLGFLAGEGVILSETGEYFNFFRTTVTTLLDSDLIDVGSAYPGITLFHSAVPYLDRLILFADKVQMAIQSTGGPLSAKTVSLSVVSNYEYLRAASPAPVNDIIFFAFDRGGFSGIRNMQVSQDDSSILTAPDISAHIPQYIQGKAIYMAASAHDNVLVVLTEAARSKLFIYKWFDNDRQRVQSSWSEWTFERGDVIGFGWEQSTLWTAFLRPEGIYLEKMVVQPDRKDANSEFVVRLDRRAEVCPYLEGGKLWAEYPYVVDSVTYGGGNFAEFSVTNVSYQSVFDGEPLALQPGGEIFRLIEDLPAAGLTSFSETFDDFVNLPEVSGEAYFHNRFSFTLPPGHMIDLTMPLVGIDPNTGYVNTAGRTNSFKAYILVRTAGGVLTHLEYGGKTLATGVLNGSLIGGWDMTETVGQFSGTAGFENTSETDTLSVQVVFEKAVDLIPDVLVYDDSDTLKYSVRPGLADVEITNDTLSYAIGNSLFRTSPLSTSALDGYTPPPFDPGAGYRADQWGDGPLPPGYTDNRLSFYAIQDDGDLCIGLYARGSHTLNGLTATAIGNAGYMSNFPGVTEYPVAQTLLSPSGDGYFVYKGMTSGDSATFVLDSIAGGTTDFRWLSFTGRDRTVLGNGEISVLGIEPPINGGGAAEYLRLQAGPMDIDSEGVSFGLATSLLPLLEHQAAVFLFKSFDPVTGEELMGMAFYGDFSFWQNCLYMQWTGLWGTSDTYSYPYNLVNGNGAGMVAGDPNAYSYSFSRAGYTSAEAQFTDKIPTVGSGGFYGLFARGPFSRPSSSIFTSLASPPPSYVNAVLMPRLVVEWLYNSANIILPDIKFYFCSYDYASSSWTKTVINPSGVPAGIGDRWSSGGSGRNLGGTYSSTYYIFGPAMSEEVDQYPIYPTWWATEESTDPTSGVSVYRAVVAPGVASVPVKMSAWSISHDGATDPDVALDFPYAVVYQSGASGVGLEDAGVSPDIYYDANGLPEIELTAEGTRVRLAYPLQGTQFDITGICFWAGVPYTMEYEFSTPYLKSGETTITTGRMQVRNMAVEYDKAGYFEVDVFDRETGITRTYGKDLTLGYTHSRYPDSAGVDTPNLTDGSFKFPVLIRNTNCKVTLRNSSVVPARFLSAEIEASYDSRARRL